MSKSNLFIGITSWNSDYFLGHCLDSILDTTRGLDSRIVVLDNQSTDRSAQVASERGVEFLQRACTQGDALNDLVACSQSTYTLLIHSDVIMLSPDWFNLCRDQIDGNVALVSPEDIGCGPLSRPFGKGMPESSFMFFDTEKLRRMMGRYRSRNFGPFRWSTKAVDFYGHHVTHNLPQRLADHGFGWRPMNVLYSEPGQETFFDPDSTPRVWSDELGRMRYGLGNFYSLGGVVTHYHNWYDRIQHNLGNGTARDNSKGFPLDFIRGYTERFLSDLMAGDLVLPDPTPTQREPKAL